MSVLTDWGKPPMIIYDRRVDSQKMIMYTLGMDLKAALKALTPKATDHFVKTVKAKGFDADKVIATLTDPAEVYLSRSHPGQWRVTGNDLCLVGAPDGDTFVLITIYLDRVVTPVRPDQLDTPEGRRFAKVGRKK